MDCFARDFLRGIVREAPTPEQTTLRQQQQLREEETEELDLSLELSLGGRFGVDKGDKQPRSSSSSSMVAVPTTPPVEAQVTAPPALPWASGSPSFGSLEGDGHILQGISGILNLMSTSSLSAVTDELNKRKEGESLKGLEPKKRKIDSLASSSTKEAYGLIQKDMNNLARGLPPKHQASLPQLGESSCIPFFFEGTTLTVEHTTSSFVPSSSTEATRRVMEASQVPPLSLAPLLRTTMTLGSNSRGHQTILGRVAPVARANNMGDDTARRLVQQMPDVFTRRLPNGNRIKRFMYKYRRAQDVGIICICHGTFLTPSEFVEHAGAGKDMVDNPLRHIVVNPNQTL